MNVYLTVDVEQDCPPYLNTWRGMEEGMPLLLDALTDSGVPATWFTTGESARRYPAVVRDLVAAGHELGCHGDTHRSFGSMTREEAASELERSSETLRQFAPVTSFRAPYLTFPERYLDLLVAHRYVLDSSQGRHKHLGASVGRAGSLLRVPASITSSTLRWPRLLRDTLLARLTAPAVLFVHPWEFVDLRHERLRLDCRFRTGRAALDALQTTITFFKARGATFLTIGSLCHPTI
jgi:peptidoglycan/xylan/chitin deacetylase (PgdA/CDA1 family)